MSCNDISRRCLYAFAGESQQHFMKLGDPVGWEYSFLAKLPLLVFVGFFFFFLFFPKRMNIQLQVLILQRKNGQGLIES